jgi:hypothetical protein
VNKKLNQEKAVLHESVLAGILTQGELGLAGISP